MRLNVLIVSAWEPNGGVLSVYRSLARHLEPRGVQYAAFAFDGWREDTRWTFCRTLVDGRKTTLAQTLIQGDYDLLHCIEAAYSEPFGVEKWVRRARFAGPIILMGQQAGGRLLNGPAHADRYVACSRAAADNLARDADREVEVIHNGYDEEVFLPGDAEIADPGRRPLLLWIGRSYDPVKDVDLFLGAVESLPDHDAVLVDDTSLSARIESRLREIGPRIRHVHLLEPAELALLYRTTGASGGAFVCTSRSEGFLIAAAEAMACGCPVVLPELPGLGHLSDGRNAVFYDRAEGTRGIVGALGRLAHGAFRAEIVTQGIADARQAWTSRAMADAYFALYHEALAEVGVRRRPTLVDRAARTSWQLILRLRPAWRGLRSVLTER